MNFFTIHINDSGAVEDSDETIIEGKSTLICELYNDKEFNKLNDILHSPDDFIMNDRALKIFMGSNLTSYSIRQVIVHRKENKFGIVRSRKSYKYFQLKIDESPDSPC